MQEKYSIKEAAELLNLHRMTIYRLIKSGHLKAEKVSPGKRIISKEALEAYKNGL